MVDEMGGLQEAIEGAAKLAGLPGKPTVVYPRRRFSLKDLLTSQPLLPTPAALVPALASLRTPLYLMY